MNNQFILSVLYGTILTTGLIYQDPQGFSVRTVVGATMFITPQIEAHELRALRLHAGPTTPSTILAST